MWCCYCCESTLRPNLLHAAAAAARWLLKHDGTINSLPKTADWRIHGRRSVLVIGDGRLIEVIVTLCGHEHDDVRGRRSLYVSVGRLPVTAVVPIAPICLRENVYRRRLNVLNQVDADNRCSLHVIQVPVELTRQLVASWSRWYANCRWHGLQLLADITVRSHRWWAESTSAAIFRYAAFACYSYACIPQLLL